MSARSYRRIVLIGLIIFLLPHAYVVAFGKEMYPFTCAGMFAYQVTPDTPRYAFQLTGTFERGERPRQMTFREARTSSRHFFSHFYGSASTNTTHIHFEDDTPEKFAERMRIWFGGYVRTWANKHPDQSPPQAVTLWLTQINPEKTEPEVITRYDAATDRVELHPDVAWPLEPIHARQTGGQP